MSKYTPSKNKGQHNYRQLQTKTNT